jgi:predicted aspartyl protease
MRRLAVILAFLTVVPAVATYSAATAEPPKISKPRPAPNAAPDVPPLPPAYFDPTLAVGGEDVKARKIETRLSVDVNVNGRGPYKFIVDSGADTSAVGLRIARDLQLPLGTPAILNGMTSRNLVDRVKVDELSFGPSSVRSLEVPALREYDLGGDGMIGIDALVRQRLMMDFEKHLVKVEDASKPVRYNPDDIVITARRTRGQLILTHVQAAGFALDAIIDTGSEITIGNSALRDKLIRKNRAKFETVPVTGVTGAVMDLQIATIRRIDIGPITLENVPIAFADVPPFKMFGLADEPALLLGTDLLENFRRVSLDFRARKVRFQLRKCDAAITIGTSPDQISRIKSTATQSAGVCGGP